VTTATHTPLKNWQLHRRPLSAAPAPLTASAGLAAPVPGLVHEALLAAGQIPEPLVGLNCFKCDWIEQQAWGYVTTFTAPSPLPIAHATAPDVPGICELHFAAIDGRAEILLNGQHVATHANAYRPLTLDVTKLLRPGQNELQVWLTQGIERFTEEESVAPDGLKFATEASLGYREARGELRRIMVRKPAYAFGWDWSPRLATLGLPGVVEIRTAQRARLSHVQCVTQELTPHSARLRLSVEMEGLHFYRSGPLTLRYRLQDDAGREVAASERTVLVRSGLTAVDLDLELLAPRLWWPAGYGESPLYRAAVMLVDAASGQVLDQRDLEFGIRTLELLDAGTFGFVVNGRRIFCQGGNWIPADALYTRATDADYAHLIGLAAAAHCNMLRVWGGGNYEREAFFRECNRRGILVWHDFMFACSPYPDHLDWFRREIELEAAYQVRRLASHPCLALWCGSNENSWGLEEWWKGTTQRGAHLYNEILPRAVRLHAPHIPYWTGSPYGGDRPNQVGIGNNHFWKEPGASLCPDIAQRVELTAHDQYPSLFISEYGYLGPCSLATTRRFLGTDQIDRAAPVWRHHTNTRKYLETLTAAVARVYDRDFMALPDADHHLLGGLWQGLAYGYSLEAARNRPACGGIIMWMWNEAWGEAGWGVIDYYHDKKPAWWFIRRALAPERLLLRRVGDLLEVVLVATHPSQRAYRVNVGACLPEGGTVTLLQVSGLVTQSRQVVARLPLAAAAAAGSLLFAQGQAETVLAPALLWPGRFHGLDLPETAPTLQWRPEPGGTGRVEITATGFLHAVHLQTPAGRDLDCGDNYFDLLPGERRLISLPAGTVPADIVIGWITPAGEIHRAPVASSTPTARPVETALA
jgi:beta-mannosidase